MKGTLRKLKKGGVMVKLFTLITGLILLAGTPIVHAANSRVTYVLDQLIQAGYPAAQVDSLFSDKRLVLYPVQAVAYKAPDWSVIEQKLYASASLQFGVDYIKANREVFEAAELRYGVPKEALAGLIAIETDFGRNTGHYSAFSVLYSRLVNWPEAKWQSQAAELVALGKYCLETKTDCYGINSSYAGAIGLVQFMPSSLLNYGVDGDRDGFIDLSKPADAIPSAANFLVEHGWLTNPALALTHYYGSSDGYPTIVLHYADLLSKLVPATKRPVPDIFLKNLDIVILYSRPGGFVWLQGLSLFRITR